jgi:hypothetical protein
MLPRFLSLAVLILAIHPALDACGLCRIACGGVVRAGEFEVRPPPGRFARRSAAGQSFATRQE